MKIGLAPRLWTARAAKAGRRVAIAAITMLPACGERLQAPELVDDSAPIIVAAAEPAEAGVGETRVVRVTGTGFAPGDVVQLQRNGSAAPGVVVEQTVYMNPGLLLATVNVGRAAELASHDVAVTRPRKRGIRTESFDVLGGIGSQLYARLQFTWRGHSSGAFDLDDTFLLSQDMMSRLDVGYAVMMYAYEQSEYRLIAQSPRADGLVDSIICWIPGGRVRAPATRLLECWFFVGEDGRGSEEGEYSSFIGGDRPADGSGRITFTAVSGGRLSGTFSITMHDDRSWPGETITVTDGSFGIPVISSYTFR